MKTLLYLKGIVCYLICFFFFKVQCRKFLKRKRLKKNQMNKHDILSQFFALCPVLNIIEIGNEIEVETFLLTMCKGFPPEESFSTDCPPERIKYDRD